MNTVIALMLNAIRTTYALVMTLQYRSKRRVFKIGKTRNVTRSTSARTAQRNGSASAGAST